MGDRFVVSLRASGAAEAPTSRTPGRSPRRRLRPRAFSLALLLALVTAASAALATGAQAHKTSGQHVIVHLSCTKVTFLMLGFPPEVINSVHPKVKVAGKVVNNYKNAVNFYGEIAEFEVPIEIPVTGEYLIQAGVTWNTNGIVGESTTTKTNRHLHRHRQSRLHDRKVPAHRRRSVLHLRTNCKAKLGQTVEYHIVLKNTGSKALSFSNFQDPNCEKVKGLPTKELQPLEAVTISCEHTLNSLGDLYERSVDRRQPRSGQREFQHGQGQRPAQNRTSRSPRNRRSSVNRAYTKSELTTELGKIVSYKIVVKNTGNVNLKFSEFVDGNCENVKGGPGEAELKPGESSTYTCEHTVTTVGKYANQATVTGTPPMGLGFPLTESSNKVEVNVPKKAAFTIKKSQRVGGVGLVHGKRNHRRQNRPDGRIPRRRQEHRQRHTQIRRAHGRRTAN